MERAAHLGLEDLNSIGGEYGPGRNVDTGVQMGLTSGQTFDLRMNDPDPDDGKPWDLSLESKRHKVWWAIEDQDPYLLEGSLPCDSFSNLHNLSIGRVERTRPREPRRYAEASCTCPSALRCIGTERPTAATSYTSIRGQHGVGSWTSSKISCSAQMFILAGETNAHSGSGVQMNMDQV